MIKKSESFERIALDTNLFQDEVERNLYSKFNDVQELVSDHLEKGDFNTALQTMATLRSSVDDFFDGVLVMDDNIEIRNNRFALLSYVSDLFSTIADFSRITT